MKMQPFRDGVSQSTFANHLKQLIQDIQSLENEYVLNVSAVELQEYYFDKGKIDPLVLHADEYYIAAQESTQIDVSHDFDRGVFPGERAIVQGTRLIVGIPFQGDPLLWKLRPSTYSIGGHGHPSIDIRDKHVYLEFSFPDDSPNSNQLKATIDRQIKSLTDSVGHLANDVSSHNLKAKSEIKTAIERKLTLAKSTATAVWDLGIPIKRRDEPPTFAVPAKRRKSPATPQVKAKKRTPVLEEEEYQHILNVLRSMALVIERSPKSFVTLDEEAIRTHFLLQLNGHYEGSATGETFNASGKTDILIRAENKNIFIAECKFWKGPKSFDDAISQLLGYLSWRDTKTALLVFNKTKNSTEVREKMHGAMESRPEHRKTVTHEQEGDSRYIFAKPDGAAEIVITTQVYDMPDTPARPATSSATPA